MTVAERLARYVIEARYEDLPSSAIEAAKTFLLDTLAVGIAGSSVDGSVAVRAAARRWGSAPEASVLGTSMRLPAPGAALVNAQQIHCQEFDCIHETAVVHAMSVVTPAALAWAERAGGIAGRDLLAALVLGVDTAVTLGLNEAGDWHFFRPATAGAFGAVAALGRLARTNARTLVNAFGIMLAQASGTMQPHAEGRAVLPLQMGFSARNAIAAFDLAQAGLEGTREVFEGRQGYFAIFEGGWDAQAALAELGRRFRITELAHKPFPCGRATHGLIDGLLQLRAERGFAAAEVERIELRGSALIAQLVGRPVVAGMSASYARLCARYVGALVLLNGAVGLDDFSPAILPDPSIRIVAERIEIGIDPEISGRVLLPQSLTVGLRNGEQHRRILAAVLGSPERPLPRDEALRKFTTCWRHAAEPLPSANCDRVIELVHELDRLEDLQPLVRLCTC